MYVCVRACKCNLRKVESNTDTSNTASGRACEFMRNHEDSINKMQDSYVSINVEFHDWANFAGQE